MSVLELALRQLWQRPQERHFFFLFFLNTFTYVPSIVASSRAQNSAQCLFMCYHGDGYPRTTRLYFWPRLNQAPRFKFLFYRPCVATWLSGGEIKKKDSNFCSWRKRCVFFIGIWCRFVAKNLPTYSDMVNFILTCNFFFLN